MFDILYFAHCCIKFCGNVLFYVQGREWKINLLYSISCFWRDIDNQKGI